MDKNSIAERLQSTSKKMNEAFATPVAGHPADGTTKPEATVVVAQPWSPQLVSTLSVSLFLFTGFILLLAAYIIIKNNLRGIYGLKTITIILIISLSSFLCVAGYSNDQLTPVIGLFGAIAGYLLGKEDNRKPEADRKTEDEISGHSGRKTE